MLSEERRQKTDQLILTAPVSVGKIVAGKYLAAVTVFTISTGMICTYPLILSAFGTVPFGESYTAILVYYLYGCACIAIGMFVSSLTESQVIAAVLSFGAVSYTHLDVYKRQPCIFCIPASGTAFCMTRAWYPVRNPIRREPPTA